MVLNGAGGWENRKTLATTAKMREKRRTEEEEGREAVGKKPIAGKRHNKKQLRHLRKHQTIATSDKTLKPKPQTQTKQPKSRRPILATSSKLIIFLCRVN
jgi:hypothetical protein